MYKHSSESWAWLPMLLLGVVALALLLVGFRQLRRKRLLENVPTSKVKGVFAGLNEVKGEVLAENALTSYLAETLCVWYRYTVQEEWERTEHYTDKDGRRRTRTHSGWTTVASNEVGTDFSLFDDTGALTVQPRGATIEGECVFSELVSHGSPLYFTKGPANEIMDSNHMRRFMEHAVPIGAAVYVLGPARMREGSAAVEIAHEKGAEMFLISMHDERALTFRYGGAAVAALLFGALAAFAVPFPMGWQDNPALSFQQAFHQQLPAMLGTLAVYLAAVLAYYGVLVYNGLVLVLNRMQRAWSLIDVQLQRRRDLIPNLVACVKGYADLESSVQRSAATGRTRNVGRRSAKAVVGETVADANAQAETLNNVIAVVEQYPELKASDSYQKLHEALVDTEDRIALARGFFNESVTVYNDRIGTLPDTIVARLCGFRSASLFEMKTIEELSNRPHGVAAPQA